MPLLDFEPQFPQIVRRLLEVCDQGRLGHAYLLVGDDSDYLSAFAQAWLQVCLCPQRQPGQDACNQCQVCLQLGRLQYPELFVRRPQSRSRQILIDDIRSLERELGLTGSRTRPKIGLILDAERMVEQAQNAFLKTLEEPGPRTLLLLASAQPAGLLPTIRSRCQQISIRRNRRAYQHSEYAELFALLARLQPAAGAAEALAVAARLHNIFAGLRQRAEQCLAQTSADPQLVEMAKQDKSLAKRLQEEDDLAVESDYRRRREQVMDAIHTWFLQESLLAAGVSVDLLPQPELLQYRLKPTVAQTAAARQQARAAARFCDLLHTNVNERLALETFCLQAARR